MGLRAGTKYVLRTDVLHDVSAQLAAAAHKKKEEEEDPAGKL
jgi:hypothetical protein